MVNDCWGIARKRSSSSFTCTLCLRWCTQQLGTAWQGRVRVCENLLCFSSARTRSQALSANLKSPYSTPNSKSGLTNPITKAIEKIGKGLQGPTSWDSDDLRRKYRDELERVAAHERSLAAKEEAEIMEREHGVVIPYVEISQHPVHTVASEILLMDNERSRKRSVARNRQRVYSLDMVTVWHANRPIYEGKEEIELSADDRGGVVNVVHGLRDRRKASAIHAPNAQVQSVSVERALTNVVSSEQIDARRIADGTAAEEAAAAAEVAANKEAMTKEQRRARRKRRQRMWSKPWIRESVKLSHGTGTGLLAELGGQADAHHVLQAERAAVLGVDAEDLEESTLATVSVFRRARLVIEGYVPADSKSTSVSVPAGDAQALLERGEARENAHRRAERARVVADILHAKKEVYDELERLRISRMERGKLAIEEAYLQRVAILHAAAESGVTQAYSGVVPVQFGASDGEYRRVLVSVEVAVSQYFPRPTAAGAKVKIFDRITGTVYEQSFIGMDFIAAADEGFCPVKRKVAVVKTDEEDRDDAAALTEEEKKGGEEARAHAAAPLQSTTFASWREFGAEADEIAVKASNENGGGVRQRMAAAKFARGWWCSEDAAGLWRSALSLLVIEGKDVYFPETVGEKATTFLACGLNSSREDMIIIADVEKNSVPSLEPPTEDDVSEEEIEAVLPKSEETEEDRSKRLLLSLLSMVDDPLGKVEEVGGRAKIPMVIAFAGRPGKNRADADAAEQRRIQDEEWDEAEAARREETILRLAKSSLVFPISGAPATLGKVPGSSIFGMYDVCAAIFERSVERSSTNAVLVRLSKVRKRERSDRHAFLPLSAPSFFSFLSNGR